MMRSVFAIALIMAISYIFGQLAWWIFMIPAFVIPLIFGMPARRSFLMAFLAIFLLYGFLILTTDLQNDGLLSSRIGDLFQGIPAAGIIALSVLLPALLAGFCGWSSASLFIRRSTPLES